MKIYHASGTLLGILTPGLIIPFSTIESTIILAVVGGVTGFITTLLCGWLWKKIKG